MDETSARDLGGTQRSLRRVIDQLDAPAGPATHQGARVGAGAISLLSGLSPWLIVGILAAIAGLMLVVLFAA